MSGHDVTVRLFTQVWNQGAAHRALLLHGLGSDGATMWRLADHLARQGYEVTAPDLRGAGSSPPTASYGVTEFAGDLRLLGSEWDLLVGHSLGGAIAAVLLADGGFASRGLLLDPVLVFDEADKPAVTAEFQAEVGGALTVERIRAEEPDWDDEDVFRLAQASARVSPSVVRRVIEGTSPWDLVQHAAKWPAHVTILAADPAVGALFTPDHAGRVRELAPQVRIVTVPEAGHSIHRDAPDTVLAAIDHLIADA
jgi:pimeloyl-ACP methyl ester carboxylesterase